eukprot:6045_1
MPSLTLLLLSSFLCLFNVRAEIISCYGGKPCECPSLAPTPGEGCTLDCGSEDVCKGAALKCRQGAPCNVRCDAKNSCSDGTIVNGWAATDLTILCGGDNGCKSGIEIICGTGECVLNCYGSTSCDEFGEIFTESAKGFTCNGICPHNIPASFTAKPTKSPSKSPSPAPTINPTRAPTGSPTPSPTPAPTTNPTNAPSTSPSKAPTPAPTAIPTNAPTITPSVTPTSDPTVDPTADPTADPTSDPTVDPTNAPTTDPTVDPTKEPTMIPTNDPSADPTVVPTNYPSMAPTMPSSTPTKDPTMEPTTATPTTDPTVNTIIMFTGDMNILAQQTKPNESMTIVWLSCAISAIIIVLCCIIGCVKKRQAANTDFKGSMVPSEPAEIVEIIEGVTANSFYTITVHYDHERFKYKLIGDIGNTGDTDNCHWNEATYDNFIEAIANQFGLGWGCFALYEIVDGINIDIEEMDDIIAGFDADEGKEMNIFVKNGYKRGEHKRKITRSSIHLHHGTPYQGNTFIMDEGSTSDSYDIELPRPDSNDTINMTDSNN